MKIRGSFDPHLAKSGSLNKVLTRKITLISLSHLLFLSATYDPYPNQPERKYNHFCYIRSISKSIGKKVSLLTF
ncbi:hypothetical protein L1987_11914 [Smallanthus sonchifolius]|uniref:Uncharacterized protein n=1 Tax=Smallanthus sonchifolius TaxID=185202 RepID=A0ACB9JEF9_9ASTR|nr:hypothetical protein L1987_11914 [Smallanthus sonchifolius]